MTPKHSPLPYYVLSEPNERDLHPLVTIACGEGRKASVVCNSCTPEDAKFLALAANAHYELVEALEAVLECNDYCVTDKLTGHARVTKEFGIVLETALALVNKARGGE